MTSPGSTADVLAAFLVHPDGRRASVLLEDVAARRAAGWEYDPAPAAPLSLPTVAAEAATAGDTARKAKGTADSKGRAYFQSAAPSGAVTAQDVWFKVDDGHAPFKRNGDNSAWVPATFGDSAVADLNVGKLVSGALTALVTVSGTIQTSTDVANRVAITSSGITQTRGGRVTFRLDSAGAYVRGTVDASALSGSYRSALTGARIEIPSSSVSGTMDNSVLMYSADPNETAPGSIVSSVTQPAPYMDADGQSVQPPVVGTISLRSPTIAGGTTARLVLTSLGAVEVSGQLSASGLLRAPRAELDDGATTRGSPNLSLRGTVMRSGQPTEKQYLRLGAGLLAFRSNTAAFATSGTADTEVVAIAFKAKANRIYKVEFRYHGIQDLLAGNVFIILKRGTTVMAVAHGQTVTANQRAIAADFAYYVHAGSDDAVVDVSLQVSSSAGTNRAQIGEAFIAVREETTAQADLGSGLTPPISDTPTYRNATRVVTTR